MAAHAFELGGGSTAGLVRLAARSRRHAGHTAGLAGGYVQGNLVVLPAEHAEAFRAFCAANPAPCPLLAESPAPGDPSLPTLGRAVDVRTDVPRYRVWRGGALAEERRDITDLWEADHVAFVLGCSFSCEQPLLAAGLRLPYVEQGRNVAMYRTDIELDAVGPFSGRMVCSMRPFPPSDVATAVRVTAEYPSAHGAPVHVGLPGALGVGDVERPSFGDAPGMDPEREVPVFWACGVTPQIVLENAKLPLVITHAPGCMLLSDVLVEETRGVADTRAVRPRVASGALEAAVLQDSRRGMRELAAAALPPDFLTEAAQLLLDRAAGGGEVLVATGFYIARAGAPETDGPPGAVALARALAALGVPVALVTDRMSSGAVRATAGPGTEVIEFPLEASEAEAAAFARGLVERRRPAALVAVERCGVGADGAYRNFRGEDFTAQNARIDALFELLPDASVGVADGGNEIGCGRLAHAIPSAAPGLLPDSPCVTPCARPVVASSSNWGAYGVCAALALLVGRRELLPSVEEGRALVEACVAAGAVDGITARAEVSVDGRDAARDAAALADLNRLLDSAGAVAGAAKASPRAAPAPAELEAAAL